MGCYGVIARPMFAIRPQIANQEHAFLFSLLMGGARWRQTQMRTTYDEDIKVSVRKKEKFQQAKQERWAVARKDFQEVRKATDGRRKVELTAAHLQCARRWPNLDWKEAANVTLP